MIKECLETLSNTKTDIGQRRREAIKRYIMFYDDEQLLNIMRTPQGLLVIDINIYFFPGIGFRCSNDTTVTGKLPMCNVFQKILNEDLIKRNN
jgi:hypothetical protein